MIGCFDTAFLLLTTGIDSKARGQFRKDLAVRIFLEHLMFTRYSKSSAGSREEDGVVS